ncbi:MAG: AI-2E family transporter [Eggerthellaceae bacterium]|nr:AI-2E family transporter [Eggerthellaceae bacterium]
MTNDNYDQKELLIWQKRFFKYASIVLALVIFFVIIMACNFFIQAVITIVLTAIFTFILEKPVKFFEKKGISRALGTSISLIITILIIIFVIAAFIPPIVEQCIKLIQEMPGYVNTLRTQVLPNFKELQNMLSEQNINQAIGAAQNYLTENGGALAGSVFNALGAVAGGVGFAFGIVFTTFILTMSILIDLPQITEDFMSIFSPETKKGIRVFSHAIGDSFYSWLTMMVICGFVFVLVICIILTLMGIPYAFVVGLFCFITFFVPAIGPIIAAFGAALAGLCSGVWWMAILCFVITFLVAAIIQGTLQPNLTESRVNINPGIALFASMFGSIIWGPIGMLIGVPIYAALQSIFIEYCRVYKGKDLAHSKSKLFIKTPRGEGSWMSEIIKLKKK